jgi:hypothetical protein
MTRKGLLRPVVLYCVSVARCVLPSALQTAMRFVDLPFVAP